MKASRRLLLSVSFLLVLIAGPAQAAITDAAQGQMGGAFSATDSNKVASAIDQFGGLTITTASGGEMKLKDCADCLKKMLEKGRICQENGTINASAGATTKGDDKAKCDPDADLININPVWFGLPPEKLAAVLAHEWGHTGQASPVGTAPFEIPCYEVEIAVLQALVGGAATTNQVCISNRIDQMLRCITNLTASLNTNAVIPPKTPCCGGQILETANAGYAVFSSDPLLILGNGTVTNRYVRTVADRPLNLLAFPGLLGTGNDYLLVSGLLSNNVTGTIEAYAVQSASATSSRLWSFNLTNRHPFSMVFNPSTLRLYVLDTRNSEIVTYTLASPFNPPISSTIFASANPSTGLFLPGLSNALSLAFKADGNGFDLVATESDLRGVDRDVNPNTKVYLLFDPDANGQANNSATLRNLDLMKFLPGYATAVTDGASAVRIFASAGASILVQAVTSNGVPLETLGAATVSNDEQYAAIPLSRSLAAGEYLLAQDLTNTGFQEVPLEVGINPTLQIALSANAVTLSWEGVATGYELEQTGNLSPPITWSPVHADITQVNGRNTFTLPLDAATRYFRLAK